MNIISTFSEDDLSKSYRWDTSRNTFPSEYWNEILLGFLTHEFNTTELQEKYKSTLKRSNASNSDKSMHINVLLNKLLVSRDQNFEALQRFTKEKLEGIIDDHIEDVTTRMYKYSGLSKAWRKQIENWKRK